MSVIIYTAVDKIASGHIAGQSYFLEFPASALDESHKEIGKKNTSIGGNTQSIVDRVEEIYQISTNLIPYFNLQYWREMQWSVAGSAQFIIDIDPIATNSVPVLQQNCIAVDLPKIQRISKDYFKVSLSVRIF